MRDTCYACVGQAFQLPPDSSKAVIEQISSLSLDDVTILCIRTSGNKLQLRCFNRTGDCPVVSSLQLSLPRETSNQVTSAYLVSVHPKLVVNILTLAGTIITLDVTKFLIKSNLPQVIHSETAAVSSSEAVQDVNKIGSQKPLSQQNSVVIPVSDFEENSRRFNDRGSAVKLEQHFPHSLTLEQTLKLASTVEDTAIAELSNLMVTTCMISVTETANETEVFPLGPLSIPSAGRTNASVVTSFISCSNGTVLTISRMDNGLVKGLKGNASVLTPASSRIILGGMDVGLLAIAAMHLTGFTPSFSNSYSKMNGAVSTTGIGPMSSSSSTTTGGGVGDVSGVDSGPWRATGNDTSDKMGNSKYGRTMRQLNADKIVKCGDFKILNMTLCEERDCNRVTSTNVIENNFPNEEHSGSTSDHDRFLYLETTKGVYIYYPDMIEQDAHNTRTVSNGYTKTSLHSASDSSSGPNFRDSRPMHLESVKIDNKWNKGMMGSEYKNGITCEEQEDRDNVDEEDEKIEVGKEEREGEREESAGEVEGEDGGNWRDRESESDEEEEEGEDEDEEGDMFGSIHDKDKFFRKSSHDRMNDMLSSGRFQQMPREDRKVTSKDKRNSDHEISAPTPGSLIRLLTHTLDGISVGMEAPIRGVKRDLGSDSERFLRDGSRTRVQESEIKAVKIPIAICGALIGTYGPRSPCVRTLNSDLEQKVKKMIQDRSGAGEEELWANGDKMQIEDKHNSCSVACVLDAPIGALLLYCLPHDVKEEVNSVKEGSGLRAGVGEEKGERQEEEGRKGEGKGKVERHKKEQIKGNQIRVSDENKCPNKSRKQGGKTNTAHTAQSAIPFCVVDVRWLLQLNESNENTIEVKSKEIESEFRGASLWNVRYNTSGINESKHEKGKKEVEWGAPTTTSKKEEVIDRIQFIACAMVVVTKTYVTSRTARQRTFSAGLVRHSDSALKSPRSPPNSNNTKSLNQQQSVLFPDQINGRPPYGVHRHDDSLRGSLGHNLKGEEGGEGEEEGKEDVKEDTRLCAGTVYIINLQGGLKVVRCIKLPPGDCAVTSMCAAGAESAGPGSPTQTQAQCLYIGTSSRVFSVNYPTDFRIFGAQNPQTPMSIENLVALGNKELELDSSILKNGRAKSGGKNRTERQNLLGSSYELDPSNLLERIQNILISREVLGKNKSTFFSLLTKCNTVQVLRAIEMITTLSNDNDNDKKKKSDKVNEVRRLDGDEVQERVEETKSERTSSSVGIKNSPTELSKAEDEHNSNGSITKTTDTAANSSNAIEKPMTSTAKMEVEKGAENEVVQCDELLLTHVSLYSLIILIKKLSDSASLRGLNNGEEEGVKETEGRNGQGQGQGQGQTGVREDIGRAYRSALCKLQLQLLVLHYSIGVLTSSTGVLRNSTRLMVPSECVTKSCDAKGEKGAIRGEIRDSSDTVTHTQDSAAHTHTSKSLSCPYTESGSVVFRALWGIRSTSLVDVSSEGVQIALECVRSQIGVLAAAHTALATLLHYLAKYPTRATLSTHTTHTTHTTQLAKPLSPQDTNITNIPPPPSLRTSPRPHSKKTPTPSPSQGVTPQGQGPKEIWDQLFGLCRNLQCLPCSSAFIFFSMDFYHILKNVPENFHQDVPENIPKDPMSSIGIIENRNVPISDRQDGTESSAIFQSFLSERASSSSPTYFTLLLRIVCSRAVAIRCNSRYSDGTLSVADAPNKEGTKKDELPISKLQCDSFIADEMWVIVLNIITELAGQTGSTVGPTIRGNSGIAAFFLGHLLLQWNNLKVPIGMFQTRALNLLSRNQSLKGCSPNTNRKSDGVVLVEVLRLLLLKWRTHPPTSCVCGYVKNNCCSHLENRDAWMCTVCTERLTGCSRGVHAWDWLKSVQKIDFSSSFLLTIMD